jgi:Tfp pilus assembly protein PilW
MRHRFAGRRPSLRVLLDRAKGVYQPAYVSTAGGKLMALLVSLFITLILLLICREIVCWYWKINEALATLKAIDEKLSVQINILTRSPQRNP